MNAGLLVPVEHGAVVQQAKALALVVVHFAGAARRLRVFRQYQGGEALPNFSVSVTSFWLLPKIRQRSKGADESGPMSILFS